MATLAKPEHLTRRNAPSRASVLGLTAVGTLAVGLLAAPPAFAADFTVSTSAELIQAIEDANNSPGPDTIIVDGVIVLDADLPQITDDLTIRGVDGAVIDGDGRTYRGLVAHEIDSLTVEDLTLRAILFDAINSYDVEALVIT